MPATPNPLFALAALLPTLASAPASAETCTYLGTTTGNGTLAVTTRTTQDAGLLTLDVTLRFAISALLSDIVYDGQEISVWRGHSLQTLATNQRTLVDGAIKRQQWDVFRRQGPRLEAFRVQAKRLPEFQAHHPGFVAHWPAADFGQPWLQDYRAAPPERRPDLDLPAAEPVRPPLAEAFYWTRFLPQAPTTATLVLPGFKRDKTAGLSLSQPRPGDGWQLWSTPLVHPGLDRAPASLAAAWVSPRNYLLQLGVDLHTTWAAGRAILRAQGCKGVLLPPDPQP